MNKEESKDYIEDYVRKTTDSINRSNIEMMGYLSNEIKGIKETLKEHRVEEETSRDIYREKLLSQVTDQVKVTVNGKIDRINEKIDTLIQRTEPVVQQYQDKQGASRVIIWWVKTIALISTAITGLYIIRDFIKK